MARSRDQRERLTGIEPGIVSLGTVPGAKSKSAMQVARVRLAVLGDLARPCRVARAWPSCHEPSGRPRMGSGVVADESRRREDRKRDRGPANQVAGTYKSSRSSSRATQCFHLTDLSARSATLRSRRVAASSTACHAASRRGWNSASIFLSISSTSGRGSTIGGTRPFSHRATGKVRAAPCPLLAKHSERSVAVNESQQRCRSEGVARPLSFRPVRIGAVPFGSPVGSPGMPSGWDSVVSLVAGAVGSNGGSKRP